MASSSIHLRLAADEIPQTLDASSSSSYDAFVPVFRPDPSASSASTAAAADRVRSLFRSVEVALFGDDLFEPRTEQLGFTEDSYDDGDASIHWDCLEIEDAEPDLPLLAFTAADEFEWEEVASASGAGSEPQEPEWEVLGDVPAAATAADAEEGFVYTSDREAYEVLVAGGEGLFLKNKPAAARSAVEALPSTVVAAGEEGEGEECVVCRDGVAAGQRVKKLPCSHRYHEECIVPWLQVRNSCPLCRFELPTDDPEYETWKAGQTVSA
ncbi:E3 ubiquitin-protein ligase CIP8-like [Phragmites australis]|uniref:E3 ubiquitin-protein ligase CIP8-like n=1 Tax=Phragmites australis TaxID=29695 RepID=UPI002D76F0EC|nr:E3 ubiquitin-protein ligase CIP8-like [Phragmites australis]